MRKTSPDVQTVADQFEKKVIGFKTTFTELKHFPNRATNTTTEVEWLLDELVDYPKGMHQDAGSEKRPGRILIQLEADDPSQPMQRPRMPGSGAIFWRVATSNEKLKKQLEETMTSILQ